ncbi:hypothetical protein [Enterovibrio baiacu]|uniref:hypothetical protein n=1 Tax=Enterovibrio baiacu TaxID=2491023 RepID=UPI001386B8BC|nr:hypothetical protein [Enterovibrio baiacu]
MKNPDKYTDMQKQLVCYVADALTTTEANERIASLQEALDRVRQEINVLQAEGF